MLLRSCNKAIKDISLQILLNTPKGKFAQKHVSVGNSTRVHTNGTDMRGHDTFFVHAYTPFEAYCKGNITVCEEMRVCVAQLVQMLADRPI